MSIWTLLFDMNMDPLNRTFSSILLNNNQEKNGLGPVSKVAGPGRGGGGGGEGKHILNSDGSQAAGSGTARKLYSNRHLLPEIGSITTSKYF